MATTTNLLSWEAFEQLPDDGMRHEILEGELVTLPLAQFPHTRVAKRLYHALFPMEERGLGEVFFETGYLLSNDPSTWIQPDVSFVRPGRTSGVSKHITSAPDLAVEIVSPSNTPAELDRKIELLLGGGAKVIWVIFPETRRVRVFLAEGTSFSRGVGDKLSAPDLLPGWELAISSLFEE